MSLSPYLLAAAGVIVLLLLLLLVLLLGRHRAETRELDQLFGRESEGLDETMAPEDLALVAESMWGPDTTPAPETASPAPPVEEAYPEEPEPVIRESQEWVVSADQPPSATPAQSTGFGVPLHPSDPAITLVGRLVEGTGELTTAELRRLDLFRPERIIDATNHVAERLSGRNKESKRGRLAGIRQYAESLRTEFGFASPVLSSDSADEGASTPGEAPLSATDTLKVPPPETWGTSEGEALPPDLELSLLPEEPPPAGTVIAPEAPLGDDVEIETHDLGAPITAEDVVALPPAEQTGALSLLDSPELGRLLSLGQPQELKLAVIDHLERAGDPAAMAALEVAFDDADPQIQLYALDAADRLLAQ